jgi:hypothetical protein
MPLGKQDLKLPSNVDHPVEKTVIAIREEILFEFHFIEAHVDVFRRVTRRLQKLSPSKILL